jgi:hypothetical protein
VTAKPDFHDPAHGAGHARACFLAGPALAVRAGNLSYRGSHPAALTGLAGNRQAQPIAYALSASSAKGLLPHTSR